MGRPPVFNPADSRMPKQPNSDMCFVCGRRNPKGLYLTFFDNGQNEVVTHCCLGDEYQGYPGVVHGGIVAAILDEVIGRVAMIGNHHHFMMSVKLQIKYRQPVPIRTELQAVGRIVRLRGRLGTAAGEIRLPNGEVAAEAELTLADVPRERLADFNAQALGWYVDPD